MLGTGIKAGRWMALRGTLAAVLLAGLCAAVQANTTAPLAQNAADAPLLGPATGTTVPTAPLTAPTAPVTPAAPAAPAPGSIIPTIPASPASPAAPVSPAVPQAPAAPALPAAQPTPAPVRIALLLPLRSASLGAAAASVRDGVLAGHEREPTGVTLEVLESGDTPQDVLPAYAAAVERFDIVIGPLSRTDVAAVAQSGNVTRPTIALSPPQGSGSAGAETEVALPPRMLVAGLSLEDEARQVAGWIGSASPGATTFVVATDSAWQQRAARAFMLQGRAAGLAVQSMTLSAFGTSLNPGALAQLKQRIAAEQPRALFAALDAQQALQLRAAIGDEVPLYGTSQLNPLAQADWATADPVPELNGARLVDIPWLLQRDHPAVMVYPQPLADGGRRSAVQERLYALGIDAYRVARGIAVGQTDFSIDGVTGRLSVSFGNGAPGFERIETRAIYRDGRVQPLDGIR